MFVVNSFFVPCGQSGTARNTAPSPALFVFVAQSYDCGSVNVCRSLIRSLHCARALGCHCTTGCIPTMRFLPILRFWGNDIWVVPTVVTIVRATFLRKILRNPYFFAFLPIVTYPTPYGFFSVAQSDTGFAPAFGGNRVRADRLPVASAKRL